MDGKSEVPGSSYLEAQDHDIQNSKVGCVNINLYLAYERRCWFYQ